MRFDEINILGDFKINGLTGGENQFMGLSGGGLFWLDASPNIEGFNVYGTNYILCNSFTYSATASGQSLRNAYASASTLSGISATSRAAILINPGIYDFDSEPLGLSLSYVDLVGVGPAASSVTLKASSAPYTIQYYEGVDSGLYNLGLTGGTTLGVLGSASTYLRWGNIIVNSPCFYDPNNDTNSFDYLNGLFNKITVKENANFLTSNYDMDLICDDIKFENNVGRVLGCGGLFSGTFSNFKGGDFFGMFSGSTFSGSIENFDVGNGNRFLSFGQQINVKIKNLSIGSLLSSSFVSIFGNIFGELENITIGDSSSDLFTTSLDKDLDMVVNDITIGTTTGNVFLNYGGSIKGTYSRVNVKSASSVFYTDNGDILGNFSKMDFGYVDTGKIFFSSTGNIVSSFNDISVDEVGGPSSEPNVISGNIVQIDVNNFSVSKSLLSVSGGIIMGSEISGNFRNINIGTCSNLDVFKSTFTLNGNFNDINVKDCKNLITVAAISEGGYLDGIYRNIFVENVVTNAFFTSGDATMGGTYSDIIIKDVGNRAFGVVNGTLLSGDFFNIEFENYVNSPFSNTFGDVNIKVKNVKSNDTRGIFNASGNLYGEISNVVVDKINSAFFISGGNMDMVVDNFTIRGSNTLPAQAFSSAFSISGTYSNIYIYSEEVGIEYFNASNLSGRYENLYLGTATTIFNAAINATFKNINAASYIPTLFVGKISDSYINATGLAQPAILINNYAIIDRCRFIADAGQYSIATVAFINSKISFLISNRAIDPQIRNLIDGDKNIISSAVRSEPKY